MRAELDGGGSGIEGRIEDILDRLEYRRVDSAADREAVYRLRYDAYLREGAIAPSETGTFHDRYDLAPNVHIFGLWLDGRLASSIRFHVADRENPVSPALSVFPDILGDVVEAGNVVIDPTRLVCDLECSRAIPTLPQLTVRAGVATCDQFDADIVLATVREEHCAFYKRMFFMTRMAEARRYPGLKKLIVMMGVNYREARAKILGRRPYLAWPVAEREALFGLGPAIPTSPYGAGAPDRLFLDARL